jgi:hypothetical protein
MIEEVDECSSDYDENGSNKSRLRSKKSIMELTPSDLNKKTDYLFFELFSVYTS